MMKRVLLLAAAVVAVLWGAVPAGALPPTAIATVDCEHITIDPDPSWGVSFSGTIGTVTIENVPATPIPGTHDTQAWIGDVTAQADDPIAYSITPQWTIPENPYGITSGAGVTVTGTLTCHEPEVTTSTLGSTTTASSSTTLPTSPTTASATSSTSSSESSTTVVPPPSSLPRTGSSPFPALVGIGAVAVGAVLAATRKRAE